MKKRLKHIILTIISLFTISLHAQELPVMKSTTPFKSGVLPNGMSYYIVTNKSAKNQADFALVQKVGRLTGADSTAVSDSLPPKAVTVARDALAHLPRCGNKTPQEFLTDHGSMPLKDGFVNVMDNATVFHFNNVDLSQTPTILDSTLLMILDITDRVTFTEDDYIEKWYSPSDQAIIVAGDVDAATVISKLAQMSYMTPAHPSLPRKEYIWEDSETAHYKVTRDSTGSVATVSATWYSPRPPRKYMNTVQPVIYDMFMNELGEIATERVRKFLKNRNVPFAGVSYTQTHGFMVDSDDEFRVTVSTHEKDVKTAIEALGSVFSSIDAYQTTVPEYLVAKKKYIGVLEAKSRKSIKNNSEYISQCVAAFLHNASMASSKDVLDFHLAREMDPAMEKGLFDNVASALLDKSRNLELICHSGRTPVSEQEVEEIFEQAWASPAADSVFHPDFHMADTLSLPNPHGRTKLKIERTDPMSGAHVWTFANGFRVIYKKVNTDGRLFFSLSLNGGYGNIPDLKNGEGAYMSDYMWMDKIGDLSGNGFRNMLLSHDVNINSKVDLSSTIISGDAPQKRLSLVMKSLLSIANERTADQDEFNYYVECANLQSLLNKGTIVEKHVIIDSLMCPGYGYSPYKSYSSSLKDFAPKADAFVSEQFAKMNDGVLVLVGNWDPELLAKQMTTYVGQFRTTQKAVRRATVQYRPVSGWTTYTVDGDVNCVDVAMSTLLPLTAENYVAALLAERVIRRHLAAALVETGMYPRLAYNIQIYPQERFNVMISIEESSMDGYASNLTPSGPIHALVVIRDMLSDLTQTKVSDAELKADKAHLKQLITMQKSEPEYWINAITSRYLDGKDFTTGIEAKIDAVTPAKVQDILSRLNEGSKVEYITRK